MDIFDLIFVKGERVVLIFLEICQFFADKPPEWLMDSITIIFNIFLTAPIILTAIYDLIAAAIGLPINWNMLFLSAGSVLMNPVIDAFRDLPLIYGVFLLTLAISLTLTLVGMIFKIIKYFI